MSAPIIEINGLSKRYTLGQFGMSSFREEIDHWVRRLLKKPTQDKGKIATRDFWALQDISLQFQSGDVVGIIGRNGAGKSTLLKILSRITEPTSGEVVLRGNVSSLLEVGTGFHPELSGRDNIYLNGAILGMKRAEISSKFEEIVEFAEIGPFIDTPVKRFSSGMYVKLAFAVAAHLEPDILIVDEVLAVGDAAFQKKCVAKMDEVSEQGRTVLFVSHNVGLINSLCKSAVLLENGRVAYQGEVSKAIELYMGNAATEAQFTREVSSTDNKGGGPRIKSVRLQDLNGEALIHVGGGYEIRIESDRGLPNLGSLVRVRDQSGSVVQYFNTAFRGDEDINEVKAPNHFVLQVPQVCMPPATYTLDVELWLPSGKTDSIENACRFEVSDGYFGGRSGKSFKGKGLTLIPHRWRSE